jgi:hypothetical protein
LLMLVLLYCLVSVSSTSLRMLLKICCLSPYIGCIINLISSLRTFSICVRNDGNASPL